MCFTTIKFRSTEIERWMNENDGIAWRSIPPVRAAIHLAEAGEGVIFRGETKRELPINRTIG